MALPAEPGVSSTPAPAPAPVGPSLKPSEAFKPITGEGTLSTASFFEPSETAQLHDASYRGLQDEWSNYMVENGSTVTGGKVYKLVETGGANPALLKSYEDAKARNPERAAEYDALIADLDAGGMKAVPDPIGQRIYNELQMAEDTNTRAKADAKAAAAGSGAARGYVDAEPRKTAEITRQLNDFEDRASALYDLQDAEQGYSMEADDQNIQNRKAISDGYALPGLTPWYQNDRNGPRLSEILAPSLPDYVSPDYRLNASVGLPGGNGFNDPQYDENGFPLYAEGTPPVNRVPPEYRQRFEQEWRFGNGPLSRWPARFRNDPIPPWASRNAQPRRMVTR